MSIPRPQWIQTDDELADVCQLWLQEDYLAVDTEFVRTTTFYPKAGLIQVASQVGSYLIDPLTIKNWQPLAEVFQHPDTIKVFHACAEDLEVCRRLIGCLPTPLADTQHGMALAGEGGSVGFQRALSQILNIEIEKEETRSNWLERPLRPEQIRYAVADVHYLYQLYPAVKRSLQQQGRESWWQEDCARLVCPTSDVEDMSQYYQKVKLAWKLRPQEQHILKQLVIWREEQARSRDVPRNKVLDDASLWNMARYKVKNKDQLIKAGMKPHQVREDGSDLLTIVRQALNDETECWPQPLERPLSPQAGTLFKSLKAQASERAEQLSIPPDVLIKKKALEQLLRAYTATPNHVESSLSDAYQTILFTGWRHDAITRLLLDALEKEAV